MIFSLYLSLSSSSGSSLSPLLLASELLWTLFHFLYTCNSNISPANFYHLQCLRAIWRFVSMLILSYMVHAPIDCSRVDYCNSFFIGLPKPSLAPLQSVLNAAACLIAHIPIYRFSHISTFIAVKLHWLRLSAWIQFKIIFFVSKPF